MIQILIVYFFLLAISEALKQDWPRALFYLCSALLNISVTLMK